MAQARGLAGHEIMGRGTRRRPGKRDGGPQGIARKPSTKRILLVLAALGLGVPPSSAGAQEAECRILCTPSLYFQAGIATANWLDPPVVREVDGEGRPVGAAFELETETDFVVYFSTVVPTALARTTLVAFVTWAPFAGSGSAVNPLTGREVGEEVTDNAPSFFLGVLFDLITKEQTDDWILLSFDILDELSPAAEPDDERLYTHKPNLELRTDIGIFNFLPERNWLRNVTLYAFLTYTLTGLADAGDTVAGLRYLEDADPWNLLAGLAIPVAPLP